MNAADQFTRLVGAMLARSQATYGADETLGARPSFGSTSLKANGKIFVMLVKDRLVVKLPAKRVDELVEQGAGERFDPGHGRLQREWLSVRGEGQPVVVRVRAEAEAYVSRSRRRPYVIGTGDVVSVRQVDKPTPGEGEVLLQVEAASVNRADLDGLYPRWAFVRLGHGLRAPRSRPAMSA